MKHIKDMSRNEKEEELSRYADLCNDEMGESSRLLADLSGYYPYLNESFVEALGKQIDERLSLFRGAAKINTVKRTHTWEEEELEWLG